MRWIIKKSLKYLLIVTVWLGFVVYTTTNEFLMDTISAGLSRVANISTPHAKQKSDMARQRAAIQKTRAKSQKLATKMVKRNVLDVSSGLIPVGGVVIGLGLAAADVYAACELIDLHNELSETLELDEENSVGNKLCIDAVARVESLSDVSEVAASSKAEGLAPQQVIENYFEFFNNEDRASLNSSSGEPFVFIIGGKPTAYPKYGDAVDFDGMKASGWSYSRIHKNELVYQDDISAMVDINFSRYNDDDEVISTTDVVYLLVMRDGRWRVKGGFVNGNLTLGKD